MRLLPRPGNQKISWYLVLLNISNPYKIFKLKRLTRLLYCVRHDVTVLHAKDTATCSVLLLVTSHTMNLNQARISEWLKTGKDIFKIPSLNIPNPSLFFWGNMLISCLKNFVSRRLEQLIRVTALV